MAFGAIFYKLVILRDRISAGTAERGSDKMPTNIGLRSCAWTELVGTSEDGDDHALVIWVHVPSILPPISLDARIYAHTCPGQNSDVPASKEVCDATDGLRWWDARRWGGGEDGEWDGGN